jgi:hypothetical protein
MIPSWLGLYNLLTMLEVAMFLAALFFWWRRDIPEINRQTVVRLGILWVLGMTAEFWIAGWRSFVHINDEGEFVVPIFTYMVNWHDGGAWLHGIAGGVDALGAAPFGNGLFCVERLLFDIFPPWAATGINKIMAVGTSFAGAYLLSRRGGKCSRSSAFALAAAYSLADRGMLTTTLYQGLGYQLVALGIYLLVTRLEKANYLNGALFFAVIQATNSAPTHTSPALGLAVFLAWLASGAKRPERFAIGMFLLVALAAFNWHKVILVMLHSAADSHLLARNQGGDLLYAIQNSYMFFIGRSPESLLLGLASLFVLFSRASPKAKPAVFMLAAATFSTLPIAIPWDRLGLGGVGAFNFFYFTLAVPPLVLLAGGWASALRPRLTVLVMAIALGEAIWLKGFYLVQWVGMGGQTIHHGYTNLSERPWQTPELLRAATVPYRLDPNTVAAYGLESFDGLVNSYARSRAEWWRWAFPGVAIGVTTGYTYIANQQSTDFLCCRSYPVEKIVGLDRLRLGNVGYLVSVLPLVGEGIEQISGPKDGRTPPRRDDPMSGKIKRFLELLADPGEVYVYSIMNPLPRAWLAQGVTTAETYEERLQLALKHQAVVTTPTALPEARPGNIKLIKQVKDGYDLELEAPDGGVLLVNVPYNKYWQAEAGDKKLTILPANDLHIAIGLPTGLSNLTLRYRR